MTRQAITIGVACGALLIGGCATIVRRPPAPALNVIEFVGAAASGQVIDCGGGWFNDGKPTELIIRSDRTAAGWDRPHGIVLRNARIRGSIRILGLGRNGEAEGVRASSRREGHTPRAQAAAPTDILISGVEIEATHRIPLYLAPGVTRVTVENCRLTGRSVSVGLYLDAESADNTIRDNVFALRAGREAIAVDGSAGNRIERNRFEGPTRGGIYLYRNCGEGGTVRHQTPHGNVISGNRFSAAAQPGWTWGIWLGSRNGHRRYSEDDAGHPFGSSVDNRDFADDNTVVGNVFSPRTRRAIRDDGKDNRVLSEAPWGGVPQVP